MFPEQHDFIGYLVLCGSVYTVIVLYLAWLEEKT